MKLPALFLNVNSHASLLIIPLVIIAAFCFGFEIIQPKALTTPVSATPGKHPFLTKPPQTLPDLQVQPQERLSLQPTPVAASTNTPAPASSDGTGSATETPQQASTTASPQAAAKPKDQTHSSSAGHPLQNIIHSLLKL